MTFCWPFSQCAGPNALTLCIRRSALFAFDSDMIIASLPGFKVIFCLSSEPKIFYWRSSPTVEQYECDNDILQQWEHRFCSLLNPLHSAAPEPKWSLKLDDAGLVIEKTLYVVYRWEQAREQNVSALCLEWPRPRMLSSLFSGCDFGVCLSLCVFGTLSPTELKPFKSPVLWGLGHVKPFLTNGLKISLSH